MWQGSGPWFSSRGSYDCGRLETETRRQARASRIPADARHIERPQAIPPGRSSRHWPREWSVAAGDRQAIFQRRRRGILFARGNRTTVTVAARGLYGLRSMSRSTEYIIRYGVATWAVRSGVGG